MKAKEVMEAILRKHPDKAIVPEVLLNLDLSTMYDEREAWLSDPVNLTKEPSARRIDALMFDGAQRTAIEVKVNKADVKRENNSKVLPWKKVTHRFIYAVPAGLIDPRNMAWVPACAHGCGIWWTHDDGTIEVVRKAIVNKYPEPLPQQIITALAYRATPKTFLNRKH